MSLSEVLVFYQALAPRVLTQKQVESVLDLSSIPESDHH